MRRVGGFEEGVGRKRQRGEEEARRGGVDADSEAPEGEGGREGEKTALEKSLAETRSERQRLFVENFERVSSFTCPGSSGDPIILTHLWYAPEQHGSLLFVATDVGNL